MLSFICLYLHYICTPPLNQYNSPYESGKSFHNTLPPQLPHDLPHFCQPRCCCCHWPSSLRRWGSVHHSTTLINNDSRGELGPHPKMLTPRGYHRCTSHHESLPLSRHLPPSLPPVFFHLYDGKRTNLHEKTHHVINVFFDNATLFLQCLRLLPVS